MENIYNTPLKNTIRHIEWYITHIQAIRDAFDYLSTNTGGDFFKPSGALYATVHLAPYDLNMFDEVEAILCKLDPHINKHEWIQQFIIETSHECIIWLFEVKHHAETLSGIQAFLVEKDLPVGQLLHKKIPKFLDEHTTFWENSKDALTKDRIAWNQQFHEKVN